MGFRFVWNIVSPSIITEMLLLNSRVCFMVIMVVVVVMVLNQAVQAMRLVSVLTEVGLKCKSPRWSDRWYSVRSVIRGVQGSFRGWAGRYESPWKYYRLEPFILFNPSTFSPHHYLQDLCLSPVWCSPWQIMQWIGRESCTVSDRFFHSLCMQPQFCSQNMSRRSGMTWRVNSWTISTRSTRTWEPPGCRNLERSKIYLCLNYAATTSMYY